MPDKKGLDDLSIKGRTKEINTIKHLFDEFGNPSFRAVQKYHFSTGYQKGFELLSELVASGDFSSEEFLNDPVNAVRDFLILYFEKRGGNMPVIWSEEDTVYLKTPVEVVCITEEAERQALQCRSDVCNIYCRSFIHGFISILEEVFPGIIIHFYNLSSRRDGKRSDCVEAFQIKYC